jgi:hypothetical protein
MFDSFLLIIVASAVGVRSFKGNDKRDDVSYSLYIY